MNERIRELQHQCWVKVPCDFDMRKGGLSTINTVFDYEKFAELIVKECADTIKSDQWAKDNQAFSKGMNYSAELIKEHFGVGE